MFERGDVNKPGEKVPRGFLSVLTHQPPPEIPADEQRPARAGGMDAGGEQPAHGARDGEPRLAMAVRAGLVGTPDNFGTTGSKPSNQALLDTLAVKFREEWLVGEEA